MLDIVITYVIPFLVALTVLIFFHELGHFWVARRNGVRVDVFSIGFGTELFGWTDRTGTRWKVSAIPLGGYVKMFGEGMAEDEDGNERELTDAEKAVSFSHKRLGQRAAIVAAGPIANFILAFILYVAVFMTFGAPSSPHAAVGQVVSGSAAEEAGLRAGDTVLAIDGQPVRLFEDLRAVVLANPGKPLAFSVRRDGETLTLTATPKARTQPDGSIGGQLGVGPDPAQVDYTRQGPVDSVVMAAEQTVAITGRILSAVGAMFTSSEARSQLGGLPRIAEIAGDSAATGMLSVGFLVFLAALSVNLGVLNLFPIPMLDGGHLVFYVVEAVRGRPLSERAQEYGFRIGLTLVFILMIYAHWNDVVHFKVLESIIGLFS